MSVCVCLSLRGRGGCLVHTLRWWDRMHFLLVEGFVDDGAVADLDVISVGKALVVLGDPGHGVLHPIRVIPFRKVVPGVRSARLFTVEGSVHRLHGIHEQVLQLQRIDQVQVPDERSIDCADMLRRRKKRHKKLTTKAQNFFFQR